MLLKEYLDEQGLSINSFALRSGLVQSTIHRHINRTHKPSTDLALAIERATNGQVSRFEVLWGEKTPPGKNGETQFGMGDR